MAIKKNTHKDHMVTREEKLAAKELRMFNFLKKIIDKADLEQLLKMGAPKDEYDPETKLLANRLVRENYQKMTVTDLANVIALVFHMQYHEWTKPVRYFSQFFDVAKEISQKVDNP